MDKINYLHLFTLIARLILAGVFLIAALPKIQDPVAFADSVYAFRLTGAELSRWVALFLPWLELVLGLGILLPMIQRASSSMLAILLLIFITLHASAWIRGLEISCSCFGSESGAAETSTNYLWLIARNLLLLSICVFVIYRDWKHSYKVPELQDSSCNVSF